jgi:hypothetical protein
MPDYSDDDLRAATAVMESLLRQVRAAREQFSTPFPGSGFIALERTEVFLADVEQAFDRFTAHYLYSQFSGEPMYCVNTESGIIPVDLNIPWIDPGRFGFDWRRWTDFIRGAALTLEVTFNMRGRRRYRVRETEPEETLEAIGTAAREFLAVRFSARRSDISEDPGLRFEVSTHSRGLRIHYSPAYFVNTHLVFGSPTTPVRRWIQPGRYVFGVVGRGLPLQFDLDSHYDVPPDTHAELFV